MQIISQLRLSIENSIWHVILWLRYAGH